MIYRVDSFNEDRINPFTHCEYDEAWVIFILTDSTDYQQMVGSNNGCAYTVKTSRVMCSDWQMSVGDFISFHEAEGKNIILVMTQEEFETAENRYSGHSFNEAHLRENEPDILIHSTPMSNWVQIKNDGMLKSFNMLTSHKTINIISPIGTQLGDPADLSDYIMFGTGVAGEIVVNSKQQGKIVMDTEAEYLTGARLYFDARKMAEDGLLLRDGCHLKVKDSLPLLPYLIWTATWDSIGLPSQISTPSTFTKLSDKIFNSKFNA